MDFSNVRILSVPPDCVTPQKNSSSCNRKSVPGNTSSCSSVSEIRIFPYFTLHPEAKLPYQFGIIFHKIFNLINFNTITRNILEFIAVSTELRTITQQTTINVTATIHSNLNFTYWGYRQWPYAKKSSVLFFFLLWATVESHSDSAPSAVVVEPEGPVFLCTVPFEVARGTACLFIFNFYYHRKRVLSSIMRFSG